MPGVGGQGNLSLGSLGHLGLALALTCGGGAQRHGGPVYGFPVAHRRSPYDLARVWHEPVHEVGFTTWPKATRPMPTAVNDGRSNPPHATSKAPAPQSLGCRTWRCSHPSGIRPRSRPCRPRTTHASQSAPARISNGRRKPANDVDMVFPPVDWSPRSLHESLARPYE